MIPSGKSNGSSFLVGLYPSNNPITRLQPLPSEEIKEEYDTEDLNMLRQKWVRTKEKELPEEKEAETLNTQNLEEKEEFGEEEEDFEEKEGEEDEDYEEEEEFEGIEEETDEDTLEEEEERDEFDSNEEDEYDEEDLNDDTDEEEA